MNKLSFIGVGTMRSGSTTVFENIRRNSQIGTPMQFSNDYNLRPNPMSYKETRYFLDAGEINAEEKLHSLFKEDKPIQGEWTPFYITSDECLNKIKEYNKDIKILYLVRHPIERIKAEFFKHHQDCGNDIHKAINRSNRRAITKNSEFKLKKFLLYNSMFDEHIERLYSRFGENNVYIVKNETYMIDQKEGTRQIHKFLGCEEQINIRNKRLNNAIRKQKIDCDFLKEILNPHMMRFKELTGINYTL